MLPIKVLNSLLVQASQLSVDVLPISLAIVHFNPDLEQYGGEKDAAAGGQVEAVADGEMRGVVGQEGPGGDEPADVPDHDVHADGGGAGGVGDDVGGDLGVAQGAEGEGAAGDEKGGTVAHARVLRGEEHGVADHHERGGEDHEDVAAVEAPAEERDEDGEVGADDVGGYGLQLLLHDGVARVDGADDGGQEEGHALHGDVVEQEDEGGGEGDGAEEALGHLGPVELVEHLGGADAFGLDAGDGEVLLLGRQPAGGLGTVGPGDEADEREADGDDALDGEDHAPLAQAAEVGELEDAGGQQAAEGAGQRGHGDVEREAEGQLAAAVPARHVVGDAGEHAGLEDAEQEAHAAHGGLVLHEGGADGADAEAETDGGQIPAGADPLAQHVGGDLEEDVGDVEDAEHGIVVVAGHVQVFLQAGEARVSCRSS
ncbi:hypothetical protein LOZ03_006797 [Ophidiomyces ophidiicola]|nr:hypothetical protein LOZ03_006797 [Ophidiomyces ophidiicola]